MSTSAISGTPTPSRPHSPTLTRAHMRERLASSASLFSSARTLSSMGVVLAGALLRATAGNRMRPSTKVWAGSGSTFMTTLASGAMVTVPHSGPCAQARTWSLVTP